jgi:trans-2-enoyl-CoA reductase
MIQIWRRSISSKAISFETHSAPANVLKISNYDIKMKSNSLLLKILAAPVNPSDINIIEGTYPIKPLYHENVGFIGGQEGVAEVVDYGKSVKGFNKGDWVVPLQQSFSTYTLIRYMANVC